jgi:hypothetical protein
VGDEVGDGRRCTEERRPSYGSIGCIVHSRGLSRDGAALNAIKVRTVRYSTARDSARVRLIHPPTGDRPLF